MGKIETFKKGKEYSVDACGICINYDKCFCKSKFKTAIRENLMLFEIVGKTCIQKLTNKIKSNGN